MIGMRFPWILLSIWCFCYQIQIHDMHVCTVGDECMRCNAHVGGRSWSCRCSTRTNHIVRHLRRRTIMRVNLMLWITTLNFTPRTMNTVQKSRMVLSRTGLIKETPRNKLELNPQVYIIEFSLCSCLSMSMDHATIYVIQWGSSLLPTINGTNRSG
jgi:hypothetical protein